MTIKSASRCSEANSEYSQMLQVRVQEQRKKSVMVGKLANYRKRNKNEPRSTKGSIKSTKPIQEVDEPEKKE